MNQLFGAFGDLVESYVNGVLRSMYPLPRFPLFDRLSCNPKGMYRGGQVEICDALLSDASALIMFECKAAFIREDSLQAHEPQIYFNELWKKYGVSHGSGIDNRPVKGLGQLARAICRVSSGELTPDRADLWAGVRIIYPVLVAYDAGLDSPGHARLLEDEFRQMLAPKCDANDRFLLVGGWRIAPLTLMTVNDLEVLQSSIEHFRLTELLCEYARTSGDEVRPSLREFMSNVKGRFRFVHNKELAASALQMLELHAKRVFPHVDLTNT